MVLEEAQRSLLQAMEVARSQNARPFELRAAMELASFTLVLYLGIKFLLARSLSGQDPRAKKIEQRLHPHTAFMTGFVRVLVEQPGVGWVAITEADLGDGIFPAVDFRAAGGIFGVGSDSNVLISAALAVIAAWGALGGSEKKRILADAMATLGGMEKNQQEEDCGRESEELQVCLSV